MSKLLFVLLPIIAIALLSGDPGGMGHDTDEGTDSESEGTGPFND